MNRKFLLISYLALISSGCEQPSVESLVSGEAQGTTYHVKFVPDKAKPEQLEAVKKLVSSALTDIDAKLSNYRQDSEISRINQIETSDWIPASKEIIDLLTISKTVYEKSQGCFDLTIKPLFDLWGFSGHEPKIPKQSDIDAMLPRIGMNLLTLDSANSRLRKIDPKLKIDLSSIAQGYSVGDIANKLDAIGIHHYMVEIGGEMMVKGRKADGGAWRVGIESPKPESRTLYKALTLTRAEAKAVMTAGTYRNYFDENGQSYSHILNPKTGRPITHQLKSVTVIHQDASWADAWDTALLCMGEKAAIKTAEVEKLNVLLVYEVNNELKEYASPGFAGSL